MKVPKWRIRTTAGEGEYIGTLFVGPDDTDTLEELIAGHAQATKLREGFGVAMAEEEVFLWHFSRGGEVQCEPAPVQEEA